MINSKLFIIPIVLLQFTQGLAQTNVSTSNSSAEQQQLLAEACNNLLKKNDAYVTEKRDKIFSKEFEDFNSSIDSLEQSVIQLVNKYKLRTEIDAQLIDSLLTETKFKHRRYRLLYPNNYHRFADLKKRATVPDDYFENVMKGSFDNPSLINFKEYRRCVNFYLDILSAAEYKFSHLEYVPLKRMDNRYDAIAGLDAHQTVKDFFIKEHFTSNIWTYRVEAFDYAYAKALEDVKNEKYLQKIKDTYKMGHDRRNEASEIKAYKTVDGITLNAHIFYPENHDKTQLKPAHLFFHGGGWAIGLPEWSYGACKGAVKDGRVAIAFDFRSMVMILNDFEPSVGVPMKSPFGVPVAMLLTTYRSLVLIIS